MVVISHRRYTSGSGSRAATRASLVNHVSKVFDDDNGRLHLCSFLWKIFDKQANGNRVETESGIWPLLAVCDSVSAEVRPLVYGSLKFAWQCSTMLVTVFIGGTIDSTMRPSLNSRQLGSSNPYALMRYVQLNLNKSDWLVGIRLRSAGHQATIDALSIIAQHMRSVHTPTFSWVSEHDSFAFTPVLAMPAAWVLPSLCTIAGLDEIVLDPSCGRMRQCCNCKGWDCPIKEEEVVRLEAIQDALVRHSKTFALKKSGGNYDPSHLIDNIPEAAKVGWPPRLFPSYETSKTMTESLLTGGIAILLDDFVGSSHLDRAGAHALQRLSPTQTSSRQSYPNSGRLLNAITILA